MGKTVGWREKKEWRLEKSKGENEIYTLSFLAESEQASLYMLMYMSIDFVHLLNECCGCWEGVLKERSSAVFEEVDTNHVSYS